MNNGEDILLRDFLVLARRESEAGETRIATEGLQSAIGELTDELRAPSTPAQTSSSSGVDEVRASAFVPSIGGSVTATASSVLQEIQSAVLPAASSSSGLAGIFQIPSPAQSVASALGGQSSNDSDGGVADAALKVVTTVFKSGLGLSPLLAGLFGMFGGGHDPTTPALVKYALPPAVQFRAAATSEGIRNLDYDQNGSPREYRPEQTGGASSTSPSITVNVQAMDARSFLDRSSDIAAAVREAMLNLNSINDVMADL